MAEDDLLGWLAAGLTLLTFSMKSMIALRAVAVAASLCFIVYGALGALYPVLTLHILLLPCNLLRLCQMTRDHTTAIGTATSRAASLRKLQPQSLLTSRGE